MSKLKRVCTGTSDACLKSQEGIQLELLGSANINDPYKMYGRMREL